MTGRNVLLGVTGGIAAYKSVELVRRIRDTGAEVRVVMTAGAKAFVTPLTFQAVSGHPVHTELLDESAEAGMGHIELARWADQVVVAPATAHFIAQLAHGLAPDLLSTLCLATSAPVLLAPAMNQQMWASAATQTNCEILRERGITLAGPATGIQACGETGPGRMLEPAQLLHELDRSEAGCLQGCAVVVTAGPTYEDIDPVRYIGNRSSGKMGFAIAEAAAIAGARVSLVAGPVSLATPAGVHRTDVRGAVEMRDVAVALAEAADLFISVAAVADYTPVNPALQKIKKGLARHKLDLESTPDIVAEVAALANGPLTVGFAAETENLRQNAREKLSRKRLDMIAANRVGQDGSGFESDTNEIVILTPEGETDLGKGNKRDLAKLLVAEAAKRLKGKENIESCTDQDTGPSTRN